jgi:hypothetical protein
MEERRLLSAATAPAAFLVPGAAEVAKAQSVMSSSAPKPFQKYATDLQRLEQSSRVTPVQLGHLENDAVQLATSIQSSSLDSQAVSQQLVLLQDTVDQSFLAASDRQKGWTQLENQLSSALFDVPMTTDLPQQTFIQMRIIARAAHVTQVEQEQLTADELALNAALGARVNSDLGGSVPRDPMVIYYNGQVAQFVHKR